MAKKQVVKKVSAGDAKRAAIAQSKREGDKVAADRIVKLAERVIEVSLGQADRKAEGDPYFDVPTRALSNTRFNQKKRRLEMGAATQRRNFFNASQRGSSCSAAPGRRVQDYRAGNAISAAVLPLAAHDRGHEGEDLRRPDRERRGA